MERLSIALIDEELPFPLTSGKRIRTFNLLSRLADRHRITLICHRNASSSEAAEAREAFRRLQWKKFCRFGRWAFSTAYVSMSVSPEDAQLMREEFGGGSRFKIQEALATGSFLANNSTPRGVAHRGMAKKKMKGRND